MEKESGKTVSDKRRIDKLLVEFIPYRGSRYGTDGEMVCIRVRCGTQEYRYDQVLPDDDFESRFHWMMKTAEKAFVETMKMNQDERVSP